jgi:hypothetical protein
VAIGRGLDREAAPASGILVLVKRRLTRAGTRMNDLAIRIVRAGIVYFALVFGAGFVLGSIRVPFLVPRLGERVAELIEMPFMLLVIFVSARFIAKHFALPTGLLIRLGCGLLGLGLMLAAELLLAVAMQDRSLGEYVAGRDPLSGAVYLAMLIVFAAMPLVLARFDSARDK